LSVPSLTPLVPMVTLAAALVRGGCTGIQAAFDIDTTAANTR